VLADAEEELQAVTRTDKTKGATMMVAPFAIAEVGLEVEGGL